MKWNKNKKNKTLSGFNLIFSKQIFESLQGFYEFNETFYGSEELEFILFDTCLTFFLVF
jgi:hypothetical protein